MQQQAILDIKVWIKSQLWHSCFSAFPQGRMDRSILFLVFLVFEMSHGHLNYDLAEAEISALKSKKEYNFLEEHAGDLESAPIDLQVWFFVA